MKRIIVPAAAAVLAVAAVTFTAGGAQAATLFSDNFEDGNSSGWTTSGGTWAVAADGSQLLRQSGTSSDARARAGQASWTDYTVTAKVKPTAFSGSNRFAAVLARAQSATSYYYVALRSNNTVELKKLVNGTATTLASGSLTVSAGTTYTVSLQVAGSTLRSTVNGSAALSATDTAFAAGGVGVATFYTAANFDDVSVDTAATPTTPPPSSANPTTPPPTTPPPTTPPPAPGGGPIGFASLNALGQNGVTGGAGGRTVTATNATEFLDYIDSTETLIIRVAGQINITSKQGVRPNKTIIGVGTSGHINGGGLDFYRSYNVIVRNLRFTNAEDDAVNVGQESHHIWIDHNSFSGAVDGSIDIVRGADYVTVSWNHFDHSDKSMLISHSDGAASTDIGHLKVTIHHNFFDNSRQRHPRIRFGEPVHVFNNYFLNNELYGVASVQQAGAVVENNYFENVPFPCFSASGYADSGPGRLVHRGNTFVNSGTCEAAGSVVEPRTYYSYTMDSAASVPGLVRAGAGYGKVS
ncbi:pectate lyase family protein [Phytohabitans houttuyneae]|uniref:pectate lyase family protein n=1 Tax=Phytohabitans houttuyneae TaxID=1076126 RepID=UPI0031E7B948